MSAGSNFMPSQFLELIDEEMQEVMSALHESMQEVVQPDISAGSNFMPAQFLEHIEEEMQKAGSTFHESMQEMVQPDMSAGSDFMPAQFLEHMGEERQEVRSAFHTQDDTAANVGVAPSSVFPAGRDVLDAYLALDADAWLDDIPNIIDENEEQENQLASSGVGESDCEQASTSATAQSPSSVVEIVLDEPEDINSHPYVCLPALAKGVAVYEFDVESLFSSFRSRLHPFYLLVKIRKLFAKRELTQHDVNKLVDATEGLIGAAFYHAQRQLQTRRPVYAAEALGTDFLALDAIVCVIQLLGDSLQLPLWWDRFIKAYNRDISQILPPINKRVSVFNRRLVKRLIDVIDIYKTRTRPPPEEVIAIKRMLFCSPDAPAQFKSTKWNPWREAVGEPVR
ncbi:hypothetical protein, conserved [Eimeria brunetti]|uniref:Uncharacterized protein n=1 Tax=Eimeria brunetti TaxID=51314 RepID=U6LSV0_9EIME|nr:hypothetical protein, conserved [Eimeria brunetti]